MSFEAPVALLLLLLLPVGAFALRLLHRRRTRYAIAYTNVDLLAAVAGGRSSWRRYVPPLLLAGALALLVLGLARPQAMVNVPRDEATVVLVIDVSGSMRAEDVEPTRLAAAQAAASSFVDNLPPRFQVALVTFNEETQVLAQPTIDRASTLEALAAIEAEGGTAMGEAIARALAVIDPRRDDRAENSPAPTPSPSPRPRDDRVSAVLLLSDGYNTAGSVSPLEAAGRAADDETPVYTIALGTPDGIVELPDQFGRPRLVRVPPDYETLERVADVTGAEYFAAPSDEQLQAVYDDLGHKIGYVKRPQEVTFAFAGIGALLLAAAAFASVVWRGRLP
jgi:Ca-activated chloride channel family protein